MLDTVAAVTLFRKDTWDHVVQNSQSSLQTYSTVKLIGVDGFPLTVHGNTTVDLHFNGHSVTTDFVVVSPLTAEAILGLDFLQGHQAYVEFKFGWPIEVSATTCSISTACSDRQDHSLRMGKA